MDLIKRFFSETEGADATEYILVLGLVALAIILGAIFLGSALNNAFNHVGNCVQKATGNTPAAC
jgi:Flp pilus assembly pilin Flp